MFDEKIKQWITQSQKDYDEMLIQVMNKHGIPITFDNAKEFKGKIEIREMESPAINGQIVVIIYERKVVAKLKKWQIWNSSFDTYKITQYIEEMPME